MTDLIDRIKYSFSPARLPQQGFITTYHLPDDLATTGCTCGSSQTERAAADQRFYSCCT
jgi:hypothetical protein